MYKVLLVDDEILIRERISKRIPWKDLGYKLAGICENGKEAMEHIRKEPVDVILTDICMPYVDGLVLAKYVYENARNTKVVIITGYDEFEYAKKAVKYHVFSYVLKPVTAAELIDTLNEVHKVLEEERTNLQVRSRYEDSYPMLKNQFLLQLAQGKVAEETIGEKLREFQVTFRGDYYCTAIFHPREVVDKMKLEHMTELMSAQFQEDMLAFEGNDGTVIAYIKKSGGGRRDTEIETLCSAAVRDIREKLGIETFCLVGTRVMNLNGMNVSYEKALELNEYLYLEMESRVYLWEQYQRCRLNVDRYQRDNHREKRLVLAVQSNLTEDIRCEIAMIRVECRSWWLPKTKAVMLYQSLILAVMNSFERLNIEDGNFFKKEQELVSGLYNYTYISEMEEQVLKFFRIAVDIMNRNRSNYGEQQAAMALEYINEHYSDPGLSLQVMCEKLAISVSYFSSAFKNYTGMTFVETLTKKRMEAAKELLKNTAMKTYEVAESCGYSDANYFSATFKKSVGRTPRDYARHCSRKGAHESKDKV